MNYDRCRARKIRGLLMYLVRAGIADHTYTFANPTLGVDHFIHSDSLWLARIGLNVKLGFDPAIPTY